MKVPCCRCGRPKSPNDGRYTCNVCTPRQLYRYPQGSRYRASSTRKIVQMKLNPQALEAAARAINEHEGCYLEVQRWEREWARVAIEAYLDNIRRAEPHRNKKEGRSIKTGPKFACGRRKPRLTRVAHANPRPA